MRFILSGGMQTVSIGDGCVEKGIVMHELMHAVGFFHEQSRTDRDGYVTVIWDNVEQGMESESRSSLLLRESKFVYCRSVRQIPAGMR